MLRWLESLPWVQSDTLRHALKVANQFTLRCNIQKNPDASRNSEGLLYVPEQHESQMMRRKVYVYHDVPARSRWYTMTELEQDDLIYAVISTSFCIIIRKPCESQQGLPEFIGVASQVSWHTSIFLHGNVCQAWVSGCVEHFLSAAESALQSSIAHWQKSPSDSQRHTLLDVSGNGLEFILSHSNPRFQIISTVWEGPKESGTL